jgi:urease subunit gamma/beta
MRLTPTERDRLLLFSAAQLARARQTRGLLLNVPEATAVIADTAAEAARDGARLLEAAEAGRSVLRADQVLPGVTAIVQEVKVEAVFDDGTRLIVVRDPFRIAEQADQPERAAQQTVQKLGSEQTIPGEVLVDSPDAFLLPASVVVAVRNTSDVPISITSHFHFFEVNPRLHFDRKSAYGMRLAIPAGSSLRFDQGIEVMAPLIPIGGDRIAVGFAGLVDGKLDDPNVRLRAYERAIEQGYLGAEI